MVLDPPQSELFIPPKNQESRPPEPQNQKSEKIADESSKTPENECISCSDAGADEKCVNCGLNLHSTCSVSAANYLCSEHCAEAYLKKPDGD